MYEKREIYGGAITAELPTDYFDVRYVHPASHPYVSYSLTCIILLHSDIRQVPDNQEVFLHETGVTSIIFDTLDRAEPPDHPCTTDEEAIRYHYQDVISAGHDQGENGDCNGDSAVSEETKIYDVSRCEIATLG